MNSKKPKVRLWSVLTALTAILTIAAIVGNMIANQYATTLNVALNLSLIHIYFGDTGVKITPALQENSADIQVETLVEGSGTVTVELLDAEGRTVAKGEGENTFLHLDAPHLWNGVKDPYLYTCVVRLLQDGKPVDEVTTKVGPVSYTHLCFTASTMK